MGETAGGDKGAGMRGVWVHGDGCGSCLKYVPTGKRQGDGGSEGDGPVEPGCTYWTKRESR